MTARERILERIRSASTGREPIEHPGPLPAGVVPAPDAGSVIEAFVDAFRANGGEAVVLAGEREARAWFTSSFTDAASFAVAPDVPAPLRPEGTPVDAAVADVGVSLAVGAAATTGSVLLASTVGRRAQLLPPVHVVWLPEGLVHADLSTALRRARQDGTWSALGLHSGPSKSADIGRVLVTGVHGPGRVVAGIVR